MQITITENGKKSYWTESRGFGYWSSFKPIAGDKRDFFILKVLLLWLGMKFEKLDIKLEKAQKE